MRARVRACAGGGAAPPPPSAGATSYELRRAAGALAAALAAAGVARGDVVSVSLRNGPEFVAALLGVAAAGLRAEARAAPSTHALPPPLSPAPH